MNFYHENERLATVGYSDSISYKNVGRFENFKIANDEQLIGCNLYQNNKNLFCGVSWITMKTFKSKF